MRSKQDGVQIPLTIKRPFSRRFANKHSPSRSNHKTLNDVAAPAAKNEEMTGERLFLQYGLNLRPRQLCRRHSSPRRPKWFPQCRFGNESTAVGSGRFSGLGKYSPFHASVRARWYTLRPRRG